MRYFIFELHISLQGHMFSESLWFAKQTITTIISNDFWSVCFFRFSIWRMVLGSLVKTSCKPTHMYHILNTVNSSAIRLLANQSNTLGLPKQSKSTVLVSNLANTLLVSCTKLLQKLCFRRDRKRKCQRLEGISTSLCFVLDFVSKQRADHFSAQGIEDSMNHLDCLESNFGR